LLLEGGHRSKRMIQDGAAKFYWRTARHNTDLHGWHGF
jgi:hypothetical protein